MTKRNYTTVQGDTWDIISLRMFGTEYYADRLMMANTKHIQTVIFSAGVSLVIPAITAPLPSSLPPWKRGV